MFRSRLTLVLGVVFACSANTPTPPGTRIVEWDLSHARPSPPAVVDNPSMTVRIRGDGSAELRQ